MLWCSLSLATEPFGICTTEREWILLVICYACNWSTAFGIPYGSNLMWPCNRPCSPMVSMVSDGRICNLPSFTNELFGLSTYHWNSQFCWRDKIIFYFYFFESNLHFLVQILTPPPPNVSSCSNSDRSNSLKFSFKSSWPEHKSPAGAFLPLTVVADRTHCDSIRTTKNGRSVAKTTTKRL